MTSSITVNEIVPFSNKAQSGVFEGDIFRIDFFVGDLLEGGLFGNEGLFKDLRYLGFVCRHACT